MTTTSSNTVEEDSSGSLAASAISAMFPLLIFVLFMAPFWVAFRRTQKRSKEYVARASEHMQRMEEKTDRMISLLDEMNKVRAKSDA